LGVVAEPGLVEAEGARGKIEVDVRFDRVDGECVFRVTTTGDEEGVRPAFGSEGAVVGGIQDAIIGEGAGREDAGGFVAELDLERSGAARCRAYQRHR